MNSDVQANDTVRDDLERFVGRRLGPYNSYNAVNRAQIWQWCSALGDDNPLYLPADDGPAVAPPAMMQMWTMRDSHFRYAPGSTDAHPFEVLAVLKEHGFGANVAVSYDLRFHRYLREGDRVQHYSSIAAISPRKRTALGEGYFVTERAEYIDGAGECFAEATISYFAYRAAARGDDDGAGAGEAQKTAAGAAAPPVKENADALRCNAGPMPAAQPGDRLPPLPIPVTATLIVAGAIASQDFTEVHHDHAAARAAGMPDIFMNILTTCGLSARYLTDWAGPGARLRSLAFRLFAPNTPGDCMRFSGEVENAVEADGERQLRIAFKGANGLGMHVAGTGTLATPC